MLTSPLYLSRAARYCVTHHPAYHPESLSYLISEAQRQPHLYRDLWCFAKYLEEQDEQR